MRAFINPANRLTVYRGALGRRWAGPAFLLNQMLVWGFTAGILTVLLEMAGLARTWDQSRIENLPVR